MEIKVELHAGHIMMWFMRWVAKEKGAKVILGTEIADLALLTGVEYANYMAEFLYQVEQTYKKDEQETQSPK